jgi:succinylglutamate desuccinylase
VTRLLYHYKIRPGETFTMHKGYKNFDTVIKGEILAENEHGSILSPCPGLILMPKYQSLGDDGFFIVEPVE